MNNAAYDSRGLIEHIKSNTPNKLFNSYIDSYLSVLPDSVSFESDKWNLIDWTNNRANKNEYNVKFDSLHNEELKSIIKMYICNRRFSSLISASACKLLGPQSLRFLDEAIKLKPVFRINNSDFKNAEKLMVKELGRDTAYRYAMALSLFGNWLSSKMGIAVTFKTRITSTYKHGRYASDEERDAKLIPTECILDTLSHASDENLNIKDKFFLNVFTLSVAGGFRINELLSLPKDPIVYTPDFCIRYYPEKSGELGIKPIAPTIRPAVEEALNKLIEWTDKGREIASKANKEKDIDWYLVYNSPDALIYYFSKYLHEWTSKIENHVINPYGAWSNTHNTYFNMFEIKEKYGSFLSAEKELGISRNTLSKMYREQEISCLGRSPLLELTSRGKNRKSFDTDTRFPSFSTFTDFTERFLSTKNRNILKPILEEAQKLQAEGLVYPKPDIDLEIEKEFCIGDRTILSNHKTGKVILRASESLMITEKHALSETCNTKKDTYSIITDKRFGDWLGGTTRGRGKGGLEESIFTRLGIIDPRTNKPLKVTTHDVRHWLNTVLNEGGASQEAIRLIFARKSQASNATYDQTSALTRVNRLKEGIRKGKVFGTVQDSYNVILAESGREDAESYLNAKSAIMTIMPHGGCTLNWSRPSCEKYMSCFAGDEVCEDLCIDLSDNDQLFNVNQTLNEQKSLLSIIPKSSPQYASIQNIVINIEKLLNNTNSEVVEK